MYFDRECALVKAGYFFFKVFVSAEAFFLDDFVFLMSKIDTHHSNISSL